MRERLVAKRAVLARRDAALLTEAVIAAAALADGSDAKARGGADASTSP